MKVQRTAPLVAGALICLFIGLFYSWSIFVAPLENEFGWTRTQTSATFTISMICFCLGGIASGMILQRKSAKFLLRVAALLLLVGFVLSSRVETVTQLYITYGIFCGFGVGLAYNADISTVTRWFPDKMGLVSGILLMCYGLGGMILGTAASALIMEFGWSLTFVILGVVFALLIFLCSFCIVLPGDNIILPEMEHKVVKVKEEGLSLNAGGMIKRPSFWLHIFWVMILTAAGLAVIGHASVCAQDIGATVKMATLITGIISICNGAGRVFHGYVFDHFGRVICVRTNNILVILAFILLIFSIQSNSIILFTMGSMLVGLTYGGLASINSAYANLFYGADHYPLNFSIINCNAIPAALLGPMVAGVMKTTTGSYFTAFILFLCLSIVALAIQFFNKRP